MEYIDHRDWAVANKGSLLEIAKTTDSEWLIALGNLYGVSDVHQGRMILNTFDESVRILFKAYQKSQEPPAEEKVEDLGAEAKDEVEVEDLVEEDVNGEGEQTEDNEDGQQDLPPGQEESGQQVTDEENQKQV